MKNLLIILFKCSILCLGRPQIAKNAVEGIQKISLGIPSGFFQLCMHDLELDYLKHVNGIIHISGQNCTGLDFVLRRYTYHSYKNKNRKKENIFIAFNKNLLEATLKKVIGYISADGQTHTQKLLNDQSLKPCRRTDFDRASSRIFFLNFSKA